MHAAGAVRCPGWTDLDGSELERDPIDRGPEQAREWAVAGGGVCAFDPCGDVPDGEHLGEVDAHGERALAARPLLDQCVQEAGLAKPSRRVEQRVGPRAGEVQEPVELFAADELAWLDRRARIETGSPTPLRRRRGMRYGATVAVATGRVAPGRDRMHGSKRVRQCYVD